MSEHQDTIGRARESIRNLTQDPISKLLLANSQLTLTQVETLLANSFSAEANARRTSRRLYRPSRRNFSRGAFNRSLIQAQSNVIRSIFTVLLLGYLGLYDTASLQPFLELSDTIQSYIHEMQQAGTEDRSILKELSTRLLEGISSLAQRQSFKDQ